MKGYEVWQGGLGPGLLCVAGEQAAQATKLTQTLCTIQRMAKVRPWVLGPVSVTLWVLVDHRAILAIVEESPSWFENRNPKLKIIIILLRIK